MAARRRELAKEPGKTTWTTEQRCASQAHGNLERAGDNNVATAVQRNSVAHVGIDAAKGLGPGTRGCHRIVDDHRHTGRGRRVAYCIVSFGIKAVIAVGHSGRVARGGERYTSGGADRSCLA